MSICYHLGSRSGTAKKSGKWFGCSTLLFRDQYGQWTTEVCFWDSKDAWDSSEVVLAEEGSPVQVLRAVDGHKLAVLTIREDYPALDLPAYT